MSEEWNPAAVQRSLGRWNVTPLHMVSEGVPVCEAFLTLRTSKPFSSVVKSLYVAPQRKPGRVGLTTVRDSAPQLFHLYKWFHATFRFITSIRYGHGIPQLGQSPETSPV